MLRFDAMGFKHLGKNDDKSDVWLVQSAGDEPHVLKCSRKPQSHGVNWIAAFREAYEYLRDFPDCLRAPRCHAYHQDEIVVCYKGTEHPYHVAVEQTHLLGHHPCEQKHFSNDALQLVMGLCETIHYFNERGYFHQDIREGNVLLIDGKLWLLDFEGAPFIQAYPRNKHQFPVYDQLRWLYYLWKYLSKREEQEEFEKIEAEFKRLLSHSDSCSLLQLIKPLLSFFPS